MRLGNREVAGDQRNVDKFTDFPDANLTSLRDDY
jgi:hypothetical protein